MIRVMMLAVTGLICPTFQAYAQTTTPVRADAPIFLADNAMIESVEGPPMRRQMIPPRLAEPGDAPPPESELATVIRSDDRLWQYYGHTDSGLVYAESDDGMTWRDASAELSGIPNHAMAGFSPMLDERQVAPADQRYKALAGSRRTGLFGMVSANGKTWKRLAERPVLTSDASQAFYGRNAMCWSPGAKAYVAFVTEQRNGRRVLSRATSTDFVTWNEPQPISANTDDEDIWSATITPFESSPPLMLVMITRTVAGQAGPADICLATSRDGGKTLNRPSLDAWVRPENAVSDWRGMEPSPLVRFVRPRSWVKAPETMFFAGGRRYELFRKRVISTTAPTMKPAFPDDVPGAWDPW